MKCTIMKVPQNADWQRLYEISLSTMGKAPTTKIRVDWKRRLIKSEHSPLYTLDYIWKWEDLPSWVSVHLVRHSVGIKHFVQSQRNDRQNNYDRRKAPQDSPVTHICHANPQAIINISRKRLCRKAAYETREAWELFLKELAEFDKELVRACVPNCVYRNGICSEFEPCCDAEPVKLLAPYHKWLRGAADEPKV